MRMRVWMWMCVCPRTCVDVRVRVACARGVCGRCVRRHRRVCIGYSTAHTSYSGLTGTVRVYLTSQLSVRVSSNRRREV